MRSDNFIHNMMYNHKKPEYNPNQVKFGVGTQITNKKWIDQILSKKEEKMLDEDQKKIIIYHLEFRIQELQENKNINSRRMAVYGAELKEVLDELCDLENILKTMKQNDDE